VNDALFFPESRAAYRKLLSQGWTDALKKLHPDEAIHTFWDYFLNAYARNAGIKAGLMVTRIGTAYNLEHNS
jgi:exodeoxyribonuclease-3